MSSGVLLVNRMKSQNLLAGILLAFSVVVAGAAELFVSPGGSHVAPFSDWLTAATNIQSAIDAATSGDVVTVTNGIYAEGGKVKAGDLTNRIAIDKPILCAASMVPSSPQFLGPGQPTEHRPCVVPG